VAVAPGPSRPETLRGGMGWRASASFRDVIVATACPLPSREGGLSGTLVGSVLLVSFATH
jgi:hypothetical protein